MKPLRIPLRAVFYKEGTNWIAHCLEFDLVGHGKKKQSALDMLTQAIDVQIKASIKYKNWSNLFSPADGKYLAMFAAGQDVALAALHFKPIDHIRCAVERRGGRPEFEG